MQKKFFLLFTALILLLLVAIWLYLFLNNKPGMVDDIFSDFGAEGGDLAPINAPLETQATSSINLDRQKLRQLTTRQVAGFEEVYEDASSTPQMVYVERGTGHIYTIDLRSGIEARVSATTLPGADTAEVSPLGNYFAISTISNQKTKKVNFGSLSTTTNTFETILTEEVLDFTVSDDDLLLFTSVGSQGAVGYSFDPNTGSRTNLFSLPFFEAKVLWGKTALDDIYVYPKPSYLLEGFLYKVSGTSLSRLPVGGYGFLGFANESMVVYGTRGDTEPRGYIFNQEEGRSSAMQAPIYPDKCAFAASGFVFYCAHEATALPFEYPDAWYKGKIQYKDSLYRLDGRSMSGEVLVDTFAMSGRELDIIKMEIGFDDLALYFINKNDQTLWMYEI